MTNESFFALAVTGMVALLFGIALLFSGYRFFMFLLPVWGFFFGFGLGAQAVQALFGDAFLSTITSWVIGFLVAVCFAVLAYLFYFAAVALIAGSLGYAVGVALIEAIGINFGLLAWLVGVVLGVILAVAVLVLNIQKLVVVLATALLGAEVIIGTFLFLFGGLPEAQLVQNPVHVALQTSPFWTVLFVILAAFGAVVQFQTTKYTEIASYNRYAEISGEGAPVT